MKINSKFMIFRTTRELMKIMDLMLCRKSILLQVTLSKALNNSLGFLRASASHQTELCELLVPNRLTAEHQRADESRFIKFGEEIKLYNFTMSLKMFSKWSKNCNANSSTDRFSCGPPRNYGHLMDLIRVVHANNQWFSKITIATF